MGIFSHVIPKLVIKMGICSQVIPKLVIKMAMCSHVIPKFVTWYIKWEHSFHVIPKLATKMGMCPRVIPKLVIKMGILYFQTYERDSEIFENRPAEAKFQFFFYLPQITPLVNYFRK